MGRAGAKSIVSLERLTPNRVFRPDYLLASVVCTVPRSLAGAKPSSNAGLTNETCRSAGYAAVGDTKM